MWGKVKPRCGYSRGRAAARFLPDGDGFITAAGPFRGERLFVPHFWAKACSGMHRIVHRDGSGLSWQFFTVTEKERAEYPELGRVAKVGVRESEGGNILSWTVSDGYVFPPATRRGRA